MKDFSKQSMLFTSDGVLEGIDSIRNFYTDVSSKILPPGSDFKLSRQEVREQTAIYCLVC